MNKSFFYLPGILFFNLWATDIDPAERRGTLTPVGVTFATQKDLDEAIRRGKGDLKNPFVHNVCSFFHKTEQGYTSATVTQISPDIYLILFSKNIS